MTEDVFAGGCGCPGPCIAHADQEFMDVLVVAVANILQPNPPAEFLEALKTWREELMINPKETIEMLRAHCADTHTNCTPKAPGQCMFQDAALLIERAYADKSEPNLEPGSTPLTVENLKRAYIDSIDADSRITKAVEQLREEADTMDHHENCNSPENCAKCFLLSIAASLEGERK